MLVLNCCVQEVNTVDFSIKLFCCCWLLNAVCVFKIQSRPWEKIVKSWSCIYILNKKSTQCGQNFFTEFGCTTFSICTSIVLQLNFEGHDHRRRIYTEEKAKVVVAFWGTEIINNKLINNKGWSIGWIHPLLHIILFFISSWSKIAIARQA